MTLRISTHSRHHTVPIGRFRPIMLTLTCDAGGLFCEPFEQATDERNGYPEIASQATALGWLESGNRNWCPGCAKMRRAA